jgi:hypothetical protein
MNASVHVDPDSNLGCKRGNEVEFGACGSGGAPVAATGVGLADGFGSGIWACLNSVP